MPFDSSLSEWFDTWHVNPLNSVCSWPAAVPSLLDKRAVKRPTMRFEHQIAHTKPHLDKVSANELETCWAKVALLCKGLFLMDERTWLPKSHLDIHPQHHHVEAWLTAALPSSTLREPKASWVLLKYFISHLYKMGKEGWMERNSWVSANAVAVFFPPTIW